MKAIGDMTVAELAAHVATVLGEHGIEVVLSGGSCVAVYSGGAYVSLDLDLVNTRLARRSAVRAAMLAAGWEQQGRHYRHPDSPYLVECPEGPLAVGSEPTQSVSEMVLETGVLRLLTPTDCVKDRLAGFFHWGDRQCLAQAELVAAAQAIDWVDVARWAAAEGKRQAFRRIAAQLGAHGAGPPAASS